MKSEGLAPPGPRQLSLPSSPLQPQLQERTLRRHPQAQLEQLPQRQLLALPIPVALRQQEPQRP